MTEEKKYQMTEEGQGAIKVLARELTLRDQWSRELSCSEKEHNILAADGEHEEVLRKLFESKFSLIATIDPSKSEDGEYTTVVLASVVLTRAIDALVMGNRMVGGIMESMKRLADRIGAPRVLMTMPPELLKTLVESADEFGEEIFSSECSCPECVAKRERAGKSDATFH